MSGSLAEAAQLYLPQKVNSDVYYTVETAPFLFQVVGRTLKRNS
jgi:hypothetical protein